MNITQITDRLLKESGTRPDHYTEADRLFDVNQEYRHLVELAIQKEPNITQAGLGETWVNRVQTFVVTRDTEINIPRDLVDTAIERVEFNTIDDTDEDFWHCVGFNSKCEDGCSCEMDIMIDEKSIRVIQSPQDGTIRITYPRTALTDFVVADLALPTPPSPDRIPEVFHPILYLRPALQMAEQFKPSHVPKIERQLARLEQLFYNHYDRMFNRHAMMMVAADDEYECQSGAEDIEFKQL